MQETINQLYIDSQKDLENAVQRLGILPYFRSGIPGFSIEEHVNPRIWFSEEEGTWEWKGPVIQNIKCAYGKFFKNKAAYISRELFLEFANFRRDGYDMDSRYEEGLVSYRDYELYRLIEQNGPILSGDLKKIGGYSSKGKKGFDSIITRLQSGGYVLISDFVYKIDPQGNRYGWGVAEYSTPEQFYGSVFREQVYQREPLESLEKLKQHMAKIFSHIEDSEIEKFLRR